MSSQLISESKVHLSLSQDISLHLFYMCSLFYSNKPNKGLGHKSGTLCVAKLSAAFLAEFWPMPALALPML